MQASLKRFWDGAEIFRSVWSKELAPRMNTIHLRDLCDSTNGVGNLIRSVELQQHTRSKPEDERIQLNPFNITVPDYLALLSRSEVNNRTDKNGFDTHEMNWLSVSPKVGGGSGKLFQQHIRKFQVSTTHTEDTWG